MMKRPVMLATALVVLGLVATACGGGTGPPAPETGNRTSGTTSDRTAADFRIVAYQGAQALGGEEVQLSDVLRGGKPVVLNFWAGLCPPCRVEMPDLQEVHDEYKDRVLLVGLDVGPFVGLGSREDGQKLLEDLKVTYPNGTTLDAGVVRAYRLIGMPTTFFITPDGRIIKQWSSLITKDKLVENIEDLLAVSG